MISSIAEFKESIDKGGRVIGIDYGTKKIGLALSDRDKIIATPHILLTRRNINKDLQCLCQIIAENAVNAIVYGYPIEPSGLIGSACATVAKFAQEVEARISLPYYFQDERLSSAAIQHSLRDSGLTRLAKEKIDDKMAACYILQITLDRMSSLQV